MKIYILIVFLLLSGTTLFAQDVSDTACVRIRFRFDRSTVDSGYVHNKHSLELLEKYLKDIPAAQIDSISVFSYASPEGNANYNFQLSKKRAQSIKRFLIWKYPHLDNTPITLFPEGEDWEGLQSLAENDVNSPYHMLILNILKQSVPSEEKKQQLKQQDSGNAFRYIVKHYFRALRSGAICIIRYKKLPLKTEEELPVPCTDTNEEITIIPAPTAENAGRITEQISATIPEPAKGTNLPAPFFAIKTNLAELAAGIANLGAECRVGNRMTLDIPVRYSPYTIHRNYRLRMLTFQPELKFWFTDSFHGHYIGFHPIGAFLNVSVNSSTRYQTNRMAYGAGISYGYSLKIGNKWNLELGVGAGYVNAGYDRYYNISNGMCFGSGHKNYWGITKASVNLVYLINKKKQR